MASKMSLMKNASKTQNGAPEKRAAEFQVMRGACAKTRFALLSGHDA